MSVFFTCCRVNAPFLILLLLLCGLGQPARATHIVGGEMQLEHQSGATYMLTLNVYFDGVTGDPGALDPSLTASIFEKATNRRMDDIELPLISNTPVNYTNTACAIPSLVTKLLVYRESIVLPPNVYANPLGYYVAVERCCRNRTISNIVLPSDAAQTFYMEFPAVVRNGQPFIDSTPRTFPPLADYACINELFYYDFGGQDSDGDSLVYDLVTPLNGHARPGMPKPPHGDPRPVSANQLEFWALRTESDSGQPYPGHRRANRPPNGAAHCQGPVRVWGAVLGVSQGPENRGNPARFPVAGARRLPVQRRAVAAGGAGGPWGPARVPGRARYAAPGAQRQPLS